MVSFRKVLSHFDERDVRELNEALKRFSECTKFTGVPDYSDRFVAYTPVLAFALLRSQALLERLTWVLVVLTIVVAASTVVVVVEAIL